MAPKSASLRVSLPKRTMDIGSGTVRMDPAVYDDFGFSENGYVLIEGTEKAAATAVRGDPGDSGIIRIDGPTRTSAGASIDDYVKVSPIEPAAADRIAVVPVGGEISADGNDPKLFKTNILGRAFVTGQTFIVPNISLMGSNIGFTITGMSPDGPCMVAESTEVVLLPAAEGGTEKHGRGNRAVTYDDVGGLEKELDRIRMMVEWPLKHPEMFSRLGITAPKGVLLYGPPGTGKTLIAEAIANESGASFFSVRGPELVGKYVGWGEDNIRQLFEKAGSAAPSIIFFDEIDSIASKRSRETDGSSRNMLSQLLACMDGMGSKDNVIVIGATNRPDDLDPAIRRPGRLDREIEIGIPGPKGRKEILTILTAGHGMPLADDVDLDRLSKMTQGFVGADIAALVRESAMHAMARMVSEGRIDMDRRVPDDVLRGMAVGNDDFMAALAAVAPSGMREISCGIPDVTWDDIGGLEYVRRKISEALVSDSNREKFQKLGIVPGRGILLYGPPGTGKTLIARAMANGNNLNFIPVNGPELIGRFRGETEEGIRKVFDRAKKMSPSIIFFDEIDSIAPIRGAADSKTYDSMVAQLLTCLDGVSEMEDVLVMAATNRPDMVDPAVLRPGRIDRMILIGKPDCDARLAILRVHTRNMPLSEDTDLAHIAETTDGYVGADLAALCREAGLNAFRRNGERISGDDFREAMRTVRASVTQETVKAYEKLGNEVRKNRDRWANNPLYG